MRSTKQALRFFLIMALALIATLCSANISFSQEYSYKQVPQIVRDSSQAESNWIFPIPPQNAS